MQIQPILEPVWVKCAEPSSRKTCKWNLIENLVKKSVITSNKTEACLWTGVTCTSDHEVSGIDWSAKALKGSLSWGSLPHTVCGVRVGNNELSGTVPVSALPPKLTYLQGSRKL